MIIRKVNRIIHKTVLSYHNGASKSMTKKKEKVPERNLFKKRLEFSGRYAVCPVLFNLLKRAPFGFGKVAVGKKQAENADDAVHPESPGFADGVYQRQEREDNDKIESHVGYGTDAHGQTADL